MNFADNLGSQNRQLLEDLANVREELGSVRQERDELLDYVSRMSEQNKTASASSEEKSEEINFLKQEISELQNEVVAGREELEHHRGAVGRLENIKVKLMGALADRDDKINKLVAGFQDLNGKYQAVCQEVEASKALARAIKEAAEQGASIVHSTNLMQKHNERKKNYYSDYARKGDGQNRYEKGKFSPRNGPSSTSPSNGGSPRGRHDQARPDLLVTPQDVVGEGLQMHMHKNQLELFRRKSQVNGTYSATISEKSVSPKYSPPTRKLKVRGTNGSYANVNKEKKRNKVRRATQNLAFGNSHDDTGRSAWIVHKDPYHFINNSSIRDMDKRKFNSKSLSSKQQYQSY